MAGATDHSLTRPDGKPTIPGWLRGIYAVLFLYLFLCAINVMGGGLKRYQVTTNPERLRQYDVTLHELTEAVEASNRNAGGGFVLEKRQEYLIRILGRVGTLDELRNAVVKPGTTSPVLVKHVADVEFGVAVQRGDASVNSIGQSRRFHHSFAPSRRTPRCHNTARGLNDQKGLIAIRSTSGFRCMASRATVCVPRARKEFRW